MATPLMADPRTGAPVPGAGPVVGWRVQLKPAAGKGRPRVIRDDDGVVTLPLDATEEDAREYALEGWTMLALGVNDSGNVVVTRPVPPAEDGSDDAGKPDAGEMVLTDATSEVLRATAVAMESMGRSFAQAFDVLGASLATVVDRLASVEKQQQPEAEPTDADAMLMQLLERAVASGKGPALLQRFAPQLAPPPVPTPPVNGAQPPKGK